jgi:hypothetical protein
VIRDEFIKQQKDKKISTKEMAKVRQLGERSFYTNEITKLTNLRKTINLSSIIVGVLLSLVTGVMLFAIISTRTFVQSLIAPVVIVSIFWALILSWLFIIKPKIKKKVAKYNAELDRIREEGLAKQRKIYANMNK